MVWRGQDSGHGLDLHILDSAEELLEHGGIPSQACWAIELFYGVMASVMLQASADDISARGDADAFAFI